MNKSLLLVILVAVGAGAYIYKEEQTIAGLRRTLGSHQVTAQKTTGDLQRATTELAELKRSNDVFKAESAQLRERLAANPNPQKSGETPALEPQKRAGFMQNFAKMFTDPEMKKSMRMQQMMGIRMMYADVAKELGLSSQETEQLMEILADRQMDFAAASMTAMGADGDKEAQTAKISEASKRYEEQLKAVLGDERYKQMQSFEGSLGDRWMMQQWDGQFASTGSPLEAKQKELLLALMRDERKNAPVGTPNAAGGNAAQMQAMQTEEGIKQFLATQQEVNQRVLTRAREFLNADQIATLEKAQQQQAEMMKMQLKMSREFMSSGGK
jgi:hypothetical protein